MRELLTHAVTGLIGASIILTFPAVVFFLTSIAYKNYAEGDYFKHHLSCDKTESIYLLEPKAENIG